MEPERDNGDASMENVHRRAEEELGGRLPALPFPLGRVVATPGVLSQVPLAEVLLALRRHAAKDWGNLDSHDQRANDEALVVGARVLSAYETDDGTKLWVITEADRSSTTVLLPEEY